MIVRESLLVVQVYCYHLIQKLIKHFDYHLDLHTASFGRVNSYYIRADMHDESVAEMVRLCNPQIILHNSGQDGTVIVACYDYSS